MRRFTYGTTYCRSCGANVALDALMCPSCGNTRPGEWELEGFQNFGLLVFLIVVGVLGMLPLLPILIGVAVGLGIPIAIFYGAKKFFGGTSGGHGRAPYQCRKCGADLYEAVGVCGNCGHGKDQMVCSCGLEVTQPFENAFETVGVICPNCGLVLRS